MTSTSLRHALIMILLSCSAVFGSGILHAAAPPTDATIEEVVVFGDAELAERLGTNGSGTQLDEATIAAVGATHISELLARVPGTWVTRGSGQEHLTAIRSPVFTGTGACGEFMFLEDGIPIRPAGFCNINNLFEVDSERARAVEVWRGPASAVLGGNAVHGAINVLTADPGADFLALEAGPYGFHRESVAFSTALGGWELGVHGHNTQDDGYRSQTGYGQQKLGLVAKGELGGWQVRTTLQASLLNQETGGFILGEDAYESERLSRQNPNPEAYRDAWSARFAVHLRRDAWEITPYLRRSRMDFLQHFLPGQPNEKNAQTSGGVLASFHSERATIDYRIGVQIEAMDGELSEVQDGPTVGSAFLVATRPQGVHYDFDVDSTMAAAFYHLEVELAPQWRLVHSARLEWLEYDYDNNALTGNTRDDGTPCGFGGCLYTRPASRKDDFTELGVRVGLERELSFGVAYATAANGFRPPQATELYRLQSGQVVADLDSERVESFEVGLKTARFTVAGFVERARDIILRDGSGFNVSNGRTKSFGVEFDGTFDIGPGNLNTTVSYAEHRYDFSSDPGNREPFSDGDLVDTAPRWLANVRWQQPLTESVSGELEAVLVGAHEVDASNENDYDGHLIFNWRLQWQARSDLELSLRVLNLLDTPYADRADFAFGSYRYFPGLPRTAYIGVQWTP